MKRFSVYNTIQTVDLFDKSAFFFFRPCLTKNREGWGRRIAADFTVLSGHCRKAAPSENGEICSPIRRPSLAIFCETRPYFFGVESPGFLSR